MQSLNVYENFLEEPDIIRIQEDMLGLWFPWYYNPYILSENDLLDNFQFTHTFFRENEITSNFFYLVEPIILKLNPKKILRIKASLGTKTEDHVLGGFHVDTKIESSTAVFYVNTNNGSTIFENGKSIKSTANTFLTFNTNLKHSGVSQTDTNVRCVINMIYL